MSGSTKSKQQKEELSQWCSDSLHDLLGFADAALASYLVNGVARKAQSPQDIVTVLRQGHVQASDDEVQRFARVLFQKAQPPVKSGAASTTTTRRRNQCLRGENVDIELLQVMRKAMTMMMTR
jgi:hypothetical protein